MALVKPLFFNTVEGIEQELNPLVDTFAVAQLTLNGVAGVGINANGQSITGLPLPQGATDATTKGYVDSVVQGLNLKPACLVCATQNITLSGTQTVDGIALVAGNRVLVTAQTNAVQNGIWVVASGNWTRPLDYQTGASAAASYTFVEEGSVNADNGFVCTTDPGADTVDTSQTVWSQFSGAGQIIPGSGLVKGGNTLNVALAVPSGLQFTSGKLDTYLNGSGGLTKDLNGLRALIVNAGQAGATLSSTSNGLSVLGLPSLFTVNGVATSANVTAANLGTLTAGNLSLADSIHSHNSVIGATTVVGYHQCASSLAAGDPVAWSSTNNTLARGDATIDASARIIGIAATGGAAGTSVPILKRGMATGVLSNATAGLPVYLNSGGGLTQTAPSGASIRLVRVGWAINATDLEFQPYDLGKRSA
jgi:hypothetical protein